MRWLLLALLLLPLSAHAGEKVGFIMHNERHACQGSEPARAHGNPYGRTLYIESMRIFLGVLSPRYYGPVDSNVMVTTYGGDLVEFIAPDKYTDPSGIEDVNSLRVYRTPWKLLPWEGLLVSTYCASWAPLGPQALHTLISVEGYLE